MILAIKQIYQFMIVRDFFHRKYIKIQRLPSLTKFHKTQRRLLRGLQGHSVTQGAFSRMKTCTQFCHFSKNLCKTCREIFLKTIQSFNRIPPDPLSKMKTIFSQSLVTTGSSVIKMPSLGWSRTKSRRLNPGLATCYLVWLQTSFLTPLSLCNRDNTSSFLVLWGLRENLKNPQCLETCFVNNKKYSLKMKLINFIFSPLGSLYNCNTISLLFSGRLTHIINM